MSTPQALVAQKAQADAAATLKNALKPMLDDLLEQIKITNTGLNQELVIKIEELQLAVTTLTENAAAKRKTVAKTGKAGGVPSVTDGAAGEDADDTKPAVKAPTAVQLLKYYNATNKATPTYRDKFVSEEMKLAMSTDSSILRATAGGPRVTASNKWVWEIVRKDKDLIAIVTADYLEAQRSEATTQTVETATPPTATTTAL